MKTFFICLLMSFTTLVAAEENRPTHFENYSEKELCQNFALHYAKGAVDHWLRSVAEIKKRKLGLRCKEIAEVYMMASRYAAAIPFKMKLDEMFGPTPPIYSEKHFLATEGFYDIDEKPR